MERPAQSNRRSWPPSRLGLIDWAVRRVIINADDFGLTRGVNRAVLELHQAGVLTSATLMAQAAATEDAIEIALKTSPLGVGCHVVLLDGRPQRSPREILTLVDPDTGQFHSNLGTFLRNLLLGCIRPADIQSEAAAQINRLQSSGLRLTHIDTHKHTHMFPAVLRPLLRAARSAGILSVRNPFEPTWSRRATPTAPLARRMEVRLLHRLESTFLRVVAEHGFTTTGGSLGLLATGTLDATALHSILESAPDGTWELITHPGYNDLDLAQAHTRLLASRDTERQALLAMAMPKCMELTSFAQIAATETRKSS